MEKLSHPRCQQKHTFHHHPFHFRVLNSWCFHSARVNRTHTMSTLICLKEASINSRTLWASPVDMTKSSGSLVWSINHIAYAIKTIKPNHYTQSSKQHTQISCSTYKSSESPAALSTINDNRELNATRNQNFPQHHPPTFNISQRILRYF